MDMTQFAGSESKFLKAADLQGRKVKVTIAGVELVEFENDGKQERKPALKLEGKEKKLVLNATNTQEIIATFGADSDGWIGKQLQLGTKHYAAFGKEGIVVTALGGDELQDSDIPF